MTNRDPFADFINSMDDFNITASELHQKVILMIKDINDRMEQEGNRKVLVEEIGDYNYKVISSVATWSAQGFVAQAVPPDMEFEDINLNEVALEISYRELVDALTVYGQLLVMVLRYASAKFDQ